MTNIRIIPRLDIKKDHLIKGIRLEGVRKIGDPNEFARRYYLEGADEILYMDAVASLYDRHNMENIVHYTAENVFIPITVGGGIRSLEDVERMLRSGADKVAINTAATERPELITEVAKRYGSQCMVLSIEAKKRASGDWEAYTNMGRDHTERDVVEWAKEAVDRGAGEILLTAVDHEGMRKGYDIDLTRAVSTVVPIPVIASGGMGCVQDLVDVVNDGAADAVSMAAVLHYNKLSIPEIKEGAAAAGIAVRKTS